MKVLTIIFSLGLLAVVGWLFWIITFPVAKKLGVFGVKDEK